MAEKIDIYKELYSTPSQNETRNKMISLQLGSLPPDSLSNFNSISAKYPNISKDLIMGMVQQGLTVNTPGLGKIVSVDGINQLKNDTMNVDKIKSSVNSNRGIVGEVGNVFRNLVYNPFKTTTRVGFAGIRSIYDYGTVVVRDLYALKQGEISAKKLATDFAQGPLGESTTFGQLLRDFTGGEPGLDTGNGFFVDPKSRVGKDQAAAMSKYGKIDGIDSFTIGRWAAHGIGQDRDTTAYKVMSGSIDAVLNVAADPTIWFGPGAIGKIIQAGKKGSELKIAAEASSVATSNALKAETVKSLKQEKKTLQAAAKAEAAKGYKRIDTSLHKTSMEVTELEKKQTDYLSGVTQKLLNTEKDMYSHIGVDAVAEETLSATSLAQWLVTHPKTQTGELTKAIDGLSADMKNTGGFFDGNIILDEIPQVGKISVGAHGLDEYAITAKAGKDFNLLNLADDFKTATPKQLEAEAARRAQLIDGLELAAGDVSDVSVMQIFDDLAMSLKQESANLEGFLGSIYRVGDELVTTETLGSLIGRVAKYKSPVAMQKIATLIQEIWKVDGFTNIRSIYGETGGVVITNTTRLAAARAEIATAAAEIADPTNLGPNIAKLISSMKNPGTALTERQDELAGITARANEMDERLQYIYSLRSQANKDPEILRELINDPDYKGLKKVLNLELELAKKNVAIREMLHSEAGVTEGFGGPLAKNYDANLKWLLGKRFAVVAGIVAKETDPVQIHKLFGGKLDMEVTNALTAAQTPDDVIKVLSEHIAGEGIDPRNIRNAVSAGLKIQASPLARMVDPVNLGAVNFIQKVDRIFGRDYVRGTLLNLGDGTSLVNGVANWISSAGIKAAIGAQRQEKFIEDIQRGIFKATTNQERGAVIVNGIGKLVESIGKDLNLDPKLLEELVAATKISGSERAIQEAYSLSHTINNTVPHLTVANGETKIIDKALMEWQAVQDFLLLPDTRAVNKAVVNYKTNLKFGKLRAGKVLAEELGDGWRTLQLVGRFAYVARNVAEMQMRQMLSGHNSLFGNPIGFIATIIANPEGGPIAKFVAKGSKYQYDAMGRPFKSQDAEKELGDAAINFRSWWNREVSASDLRSKKRSQVFNSFKVVGSDHPEFLEGLAYSVNNFVSDKFMPTIVRLMGATKEQQRAALDNLVNNFDVKDNPLRNFVSSIFNKNSGLREIYLKDASATGPGVTKANLNVEDIFIHMFDEKQADSMVSQLSALAGQGPKSQLILDLIRKGSISVERNGKLIEIKAPYANSGKTIEELSQLEREFIKRMKAEFTPEDLIGSTVFVKSQEIAWGAAEGSVKSFVNGFFNLAAYAESKLNFGPEFQMAYWDFAGGYAPMVKTEDLITMRNNANRALAPLTKFDPLNKITKKSIRLRQHPALRTINKELKRRQKDPSYVGGTTSLKTIDTMAAREASNYVRDLFYDAGRQKQYAQAVRLVFPFAQAHYNTLNKWAELSKNPAPALKFAKAFNSLNQQGSNTLYEISGMEYDENQGFFYQDTPTGPKKFKMPLVGNVLGAMAGKLAGVEGMSQAFQMTSPVQSLNLAMGQVNPGLPGIGPAFQGLYTATGKATAFGPVNDILRDMITPFGKPTSVEDFVFPAWLKKSVAYRMGDEATVQRGIKEWAAQLASTGLYGENPLASDGERNRLFQDAEKLSREIGFMSALFQSISASTPDGEVLATIKDPNNKQTFVTMTMLFDNWQKISDQNLGNYGKAVAVFADTYGVENLLVAMGGSTPGVRGTEDAWTWLNNNPDAASKYAKSPADVVPYFFPGGEYSLKYYNWQKSSGARRQLSRVELERESQSMVYAMLKSRIADEQVANLYGTSWYTEQIAKLDKQFGNARPADTVVTGSAGEKVASIRLALQDPALKQSPVYKQISEFYPRYQELQDLLNKNNVSNYAQLTSKGGQPTLMRNELLALAQKLMIENPAFSRMYYGVFAGILEDK